MTMIPVNASDRFDAIFAAVIASCEEFCAGARHGRNIECRHSEQANRSSPDRERLAFTRSGVAPAA